MDDFNIEQLLERMHADFASNNWRKMHGYPLRRKSCNKRYKEFRKKHGAPASKSDSVTRTFLGMTLRVLRTWNPKNFDNPMTCGISGAGKTRFSITPNLNSNLHNE